MIAKMRRSFCLSKCGAILASSLLAACTPHPVRINPPFPTVRVIPTSKRATPSLEDPGKIIVVDGTDCGETRERQRAIELPGSFTLPSYANGATVFLNGWRLRYLEADHHVRLLDVAIHNISLANGTLSWLARGQIEDEDADKPYAFCYTYTVLAWNTGFVDAGVHDADANSNGRQAFEALGGGDSTALTSLFSFADTSAFVLKKTRAVLPRGFLLFWENESRIFPACFDCPVDHHLLQVAYNLDHNESFLQKGKTYDSLGTPPPIVQDASRIDPGFTSWQSNAILKDNDLRHDFSFSELFSILGGDDISLVQPPFMILPQEPVRNCITASGAVRTQEFEIRNVPFDYAVPVLSGWNLYYDCSDAHVADVGIWLENIQYEKNPAQTVGVLHYKVSSVLRDEEGPPGHLTDHKVNILGIKGRQPADLVPRSTASNFCSLDPQGRLLLAVANIGQGDAPASTTTLLFSTLSGPPLPVDVPTPPIPKGFIVNLDPIDIPNVCPSECSFTVTVDSLNVVVETDETNNVANGHCIR